MPILVNKIYLVATEDMDEAYKLTTPSSDKVATYQVAGMRPFDPTQPQAPGPRQGPQLPETPPRPPLAPAQNLPTPQPTPSS